YQSQQYVCIKCKKPSDYKYSKEDLEKIEAIVKKLNTDRRLLHAETVATALAIDEASRKYVQTVVAKNTENMKKNTDKENEFKFIDDFIETLQGLVGNEIKGVAINETKGEHPIYLKYNTYIID